MRIIKVIFLSLLALVLVLGTGVFIFFQTFDTDQYLPQITRKAALALGRPVSIGHLWLGLSSRGITLDAGPLIIADDQDFTTQPFVKVDMVRISFDLKSLIFQRQIHITGILLQSPQIHFIRSQEGNINARTIGQAGQQPALPTAGYAGDNTVLGNSGVSVSSGTGSPNVALKQRAVFPAVNIKSLKIRDASISFIDQSQGMPLDIWLSDINASLEGSSLLKPLRLSFDASLYSNAPNVQGSALLSLDLSKRSVQISDLSLHMDLSHLDRDQLKGISPEIPQDSPVFKNISGVVQLNLAHLGTGSSGDFETNGDIAITGVVIKDFNIINEVLSHTLGVFGNVESVIDNLLNGRLKDALGAKDTVIEKAGAQFSYHDKTVFIDNALVKTNIFEFTAQGSVGRGFNMDMQTVLHLNSDVSAALANGLDGLKFLCDDDKRITIDASLKGAYPHLKYKPNKDFRKKIKRAFIYNIPFL